MENKKKSEINNCNSYKEYNININKTIYNLRIEILEQNINIIIKELNTPLDYNYKVQLNLIDLLKKLDISDFALSNYDLIFKKFDEKYKEQQLIIIINNNDIMNLIIKNNKSTKKCEINLYKAKMNNDDKFNILYNQIQFMGNNNNHVNNNNIDIKNITKKIDNTNLNMNKKEDDIKNQINHQDIVIEEINNNLKQIIKNQKIFFEDIEKKLKEMEVELEDKIREKLYINLFIKKINFKQKKEKKKKSPLYLGFISENEIYNFRTNFKNALLKNHKFNDTEIVEINIQGNKLNLHNEYSSIEIFNINTFNYFNFMDFSHDYMKTASSILSFSIKLKNGNSNIFEFLKIPPKIESFLQKYEFSEKYEIYTNIKNNKISLDFANFENDFINKIDSDLSVFHDLYFSIKSQFCPIDIHINSSEELLTKIFNIIIELKANIHDIKYILNSFIDALEKVELPNIEKEKKENFILKLYILKFFISAKMDFSFQSFHIFKTFFPSFFKRYTEDKESLGADIKSWISSLFQLNKELCELFKTFKELLFNFDEISISFVYPKYKNGYGLIIKLPNLSKVMSYFLS